MEIAESICAWAKERARTIEGWANFYKATFGLSGEIYRRHPDQQSRAEFYNSAEYKELQLLFVQLREQFENIGPTEDKVRVITVRLPKAMHEVLRNEAHEHHTSMNKLCISKLVQPPDARLIPRDKETVARLAPPVVVPPYKSQRPNPTFRSGLPGLGSVKPNDDA